MISTHCFHHADRESVARCPSCRRCFCRECITEHDGRVICARCLAQLLETPTSPVRTSAWISTPLTVLAGLASAWILFYVLGWIVLHIPDDIHDGTRWNSPALQP